LVTIKPAIPNLNETVNWSNNILKAKTDQMLVLGLDFGGTKLAAGVVDLVSARLIDAGIVPTRTNAGASGAVADINSLASKLDGVDLIAGIGVSFGGHVHQGVIQRSLHIQGWEDFQLGEHITNHFGSIEMRIANDANVVALGEWRFGAGLGANSMIYITVSTGIGGGIILNGKLYHGSTGMVGEIGHMKVQPAGPTCACGRHGCLEAVAAGPAIVRNALEARRTHPEIRSQIPQRGELTVKDIVLLANKGDELAIQVLEQAGRDLGLGIANAINLLDPERVVIGGGVSRAGEVWWDAVTETAQTEMISQPNAVDIRLAELGQYGGVWGAAALFM
jgi:glucokinase